MHWFLVHTKPRQENRALSNLLEQGFQCYLPTIRCEKQRQGELKTQPEPLFPRYMFIQPGVDGRGSLGAVRSTKGVSRLVTFGAEPAKVDESLVLTLQQLEQQQHKPLALFEPGERVLIADGPLAGLDGVFLMKDGERRAMVLVEMLSCNNQVGIPVGSLRKYR